jgi:endonuclease/exonuclease/phosphatase (EEP) superfamily protein YafD
MAEKLTPTTEKYIYQGDLNYNDSSIAEYLPKLIEAGIREVILTEPTTPKGRKYDHVLYRGVTHLKSTIISDVLTDHFPIYSEFEI